MANSRICFKNRKQQFVNSFCQQACITDVNSLSFKFQYSTATRWNLSTTTGFNRAICGDKSPLLCINKTIKTHWMGYPGLRSCWRELPGPHHHCHRAMWPSQRNKGSLVNRLFTSEPGATARFPWGTNSPPCHYDWCGQSPNPNL